MRFIDTSPKWIRLARLKRNGLTQSFTRMSTWGVVSYDFKYSDPVADESQKIGLEELIVRSVDLKPGRYSWIEVVGTGTGEVIPKAEGSTYSFQCEYMTDKASMLCTNWKVSQLLWNGNDETEDLQYARFTVEADGRWQFTDCEVDSHDVEEYEWCFGQNEEEIVLWEEIGDSPPETLDIVELVDNRLRLSWSSSGDSMDVTLQSIE